MATEVEKAAATFYRRLAEKSRNVALAEVFQVLSEHEEDHQAMIEKIALQYKDDDRQMENSTDISGLMKIDREKMEALLDREIGDADITEVKEAIDIAIKGEEDTILIYSWLINALDEMNRSVLSDIIVSERSHRDLVTGLRNKLFPS